MGSQHPRDDIQIVLQVSVDTDQDIASGCHQPREQGDLMTAVARELMPQTGEPCASLASRINRQVASRLPSSTSQTRLSTCMVPTPAKRDRRAHHPAQGFGQYFLFVVARHHNAYDGTHMQCRDIIDIQHGTISHSWAIKPR